MDGNFASGFVIGFVLASVLGFIVTRMRLAYKRVQMASRPPAPLPTAKLSPWAVVMQGVRAMIGLFLWLVAFGAVALGAYLLISRGPWF